MNPNAVDVLLVEDNLDDAELTIWELKRHHMSNNLVHVRDERTRAIPVIILTSSQV